MMLHPTAEITVDRAALLQGLKILGSAAADRLGEEAILSFEGTHLSIAIGGGTHEVPTSGGWNLQIRIPGKMLLKLATVMPPADPMALVVEDGVKLRFGSVALPCYLQPLGSNVIDLPVNAEQTDIVESLAAYSSQQIEHSGLAQVHAIAMEKHTIKEAARLLAPFGISEWELFDLVETKRPHHTDFAPMKEHFLHYATTDQRGMSALAKLDRKLAISSSEIFTISFAEETGSDSSYKCDATFAAALAVVIARIRDRKKGFRFGKVPKIADELFAKNWFFQGKPLAETREKVHSTRLPFRHFKTSEINEFLDYLDEFLEGKGLPPLDSTFCLQLLQCLGEVFVNTETHSESALGVFVSGQHYPAQQRLVLTIADAGVTIPKRIAQRFGSQLSPVHALAWAMKKGNTTKVNTPGGIGLKLLRDFAREQHGEVWIASGRAFWEMRSGVETISELDDPFPGTVVTLKIPTEPTPGALPPELSVLSDPPNLPHE